MEGLLPDPLPVLGLLPELEFPDPDEEPPPGVELELPVLPVWLPVALEVAAAPWSPPPCS